MGLYQHVGRLLALKEYAPRRPPSGETPAGRRRPALRLFWSVIDWCQRSSFAARFAVSGFGTLGRAQAAEDPNKTAFQSNDERGCAKKDRQRQSIAFSETGKRKGCDHAALANAPPRNRYWYG